MTIPDPVPAWLTPEQCAEYIDVDVKLVYRLVDQHRIPCLRAEAERSAIRIPRDGLVPAAMQWLTQEAEPADNVEAARSKIRRLQASR